MRLRKGSFTRSLLPPCPHIELPWFVGIATLTALLVAPLAQADAETAERPRYCLLLTQVEVADGVPAQLAEDIRTRLIAAIESRAELAGFLPQDSPDPTREPDAFKAFMKRQRLTAYRINVEVTAYRHQVAEGTRGRELTVHLALRAFGETMPKPAFGFTADGAATVKLEIGRRLRPRDSEIAHRQVASQAVDQALAESVRRLDEKHKKSKHKRGAHKHKRGAKPNRQSGKKN